MEFLPRSGSKQYGWSAAIVRNTNKHLGTDKLGGMTSRIRGQAPKRHLKWRRLMTNFCFFGEEFHWDRMHYGSSNKGQ